MIKKIALFLIPAILFNILFLISIWAHRTFVTGLNPYIASLGLLLFLLIAAPLAVYAIRELIRSYKGKLPFDPAMTFLLGFFIFLIGNFISKWAFGSYTLTLDIQLHDTYFVIAHAHIMLFFALVFLVFSAIYFFYPWIHGRVMNAPMGHIHFGITLVGVYLLSWPQQYIDLSGMPRRYIDYSNWTTLDQSNHFQSIVIILLTIAQVLFLINLIYSAIRGKKYGITH